MHVTRNKSCFNFDYFENNYRIYMNLHTIKATTNGNINREGKILAKTSRYEAICLRLFNTYMNALFFSFCQMYTFVLSPHSKSAQTNLLL